MYSGTVMDRHRLATSQSGRRTYLASALEVAGQNGVVETAGLLAGCIPLLRAVACRFVGSRSHSVQMKSCSVHTEARSSWPSVRKISLRSAADRLRRFRASALGEQVASLPLLS